MYEQPKAELLLAQSEDIMDLGMFDSLETDNGVGIDGLLDGLQ